ncbi:MULTISPECIES: hypothetical protein [Ralstonia]|uniref:Lipoprotein n=2 Tax=Ralstonia TaxID=48736 RepID=A0AAD2BSY5_9RALS|nr:MULTISPECIES: hypothetical protein [Ralstonia]NMV39916.1 hypothetical protein [Ralstonia insidiosa]CAJ0807439.1 hypothetical protein R77560_04575 [Ralstonia sp. LMG 18095]
MRRKLILPLLVIAALCGACSKEQPAPASESAAAKDKPSEDAGLDKVYGGLTSNSVKRSKSE